MIVPILVGAVLLGAALSLAGLAAAALALRDGRRALRSPGAPLPVSVLKPLKGIDDGLMENLESLFLQDHPGYEVVFCAETAGDPALRVARKVMERHPSVPARIVTGGSRDGLNPKVANLRPGLASCRHPLVLVSDSNVRVPPTYLREASGRFADPSVGLVTHLVRGVGGRSLGARLENGHLNAFVLPSVALLDRLAGRPCVVGKSMMMRREALAAAGGLEAVRDVLAEDYLLGRLVQEAGYRVVVSGAPVDTVDRYRTASQFLARHSRWARMRRSIAGGAYLLEALHFPVVLSAAAAVLSGGAPSSLWFLAAAVAFRVAADYGVGLLLQAPSLAVALSGPLREVLAAAVFLASFLPGTVEWRGRTLRIGEGSRLVPVGEAEGEGAEAAEAGRAA